LSCIILHVDVSDVVLGVTRMSQKVNVYVAIPVVLIVCTVSLLVVTESGRRLHEKLNTCKDRTIATSRRRYSTSDEMQYILFGVGNQFSPYDQQLAEFIRSHTSEPTLTRPRQLTYPRKTDASQHGQSLFVDKLLSGRRNGFFVECGAADGETFSNSLFFELKRNWTGLLIEANPYFYRTLLGKNRRAYVLQGCLSTERRPMTVQMLPADDGLVSGIVGKMHQAQVSAIGNKKKPEVAVNCFPLSAIMAALNISHVDYLSLDVEGPEVEILRTVDWTRLHIDVITAEYQIYGGSDSGALKKLKDLRGFFSKTGVYREVALLPADSDDVHAIDVVFSRI